MKRIICIFLVPFVLIYAEILYAQLDFLPLRADYATFFGNADKTFTEVYLAFYQSDIAYHVEDTTQVAHFTHTLKIYQNDSLFQQIEKHYTSAMGLNTDTRGMNQFMDVFPFELEPGKYNLVASVVDEVAKKSGEYTLEMDVPEYGSSLVISDIELSTKISKTGTESAFSNKNNLEIFPNPSSTFGIVQPILYFYFEVYNLKLNTDGKNRYRYHYFISDIEGRRVRDFPEKIKSSSSKVIAEAGGTNIITLPAEEFYLNIEVEDMRTNKKAFNRKKFRVDKPDRQRSDNQVQARLGGYEEYMDYGRNELEAEFEKLSYIATEQEQQVFNELDVEGMRRFLAEFWKRRDPDPTTEINEYKRTYFENLQYANATFASAFKDGWRTDQGRVILVYGKPDEIERHPSSMNSQPYEIWHYYALEGGSYFVFADLTGHGNFDLLHSNYRNEIKDNNWRQRIGSVRTEFESPGFE